MLISFSADAESGTRERNISPKSVRFTGRLPAALKRQSLDGHRQGVQMGRNRRLAAFSIASFIVVYLYDFRMRQFWHRIC